MVLGVFRRWLFAAHEGFEAGDLFAGAEDYEGIVGADGVLGGGGGVEPALRGSDGEDHGPGLLSDLELCDGVVRHGEPFGTSNSSSLNSMPFSPRVTMSRKSTIRGWVAREARRRPPTA